MGWWKNCFLVATGVVAGALLYETVMNDDKEDDDDDDDAVEAVDEDDVETTETDGMGLLVSKVRREAMLAMACCTSDEEREVVYAQVKESVQEMQDALAKKGEALIEQLKEKVGQQGTAEEDSVAQSIQSIEDAMKQIRESLEDTLESLKPAAPETAL